MSFCKINRVSLIKERLKTHSLNGVLIPPLKGMDSKFFYGGMRHGIECFFVLLSPNLWSLDSLTVW